ncbi:hypothetical protein ACWDDN_30585 [Streptomyces griseoruber]|uniref:hypothetical protein n=1 Tax=Streptomyces griseoruber TaxID=1943 RepID=UPI0037928646
MNGFLLGRHREAGPQLTLYCPAPLLRTGDNTVTVLDLERLGTAVELREQAGPGPPEEYVEEFDRQLSSGRDRRGRGVHGCATSSYRA